MTDEQLEALKHSLRIREIVLDKLVLALIVIAAGLYGNFLLKQHEATLSRELEGLKAGYNLQRVLAEKEIAAHEAAWKAVTAFRTTIDSFIGKPFSEAAEAQVENAARTLSADLDLHRFYLTDRSRKVVEDFFNSQIPLLIDAWSGEDGRGDLTREKWESFVTSAENVRNVLVEEVKRRNINGGNGGASLGRITPASTGRPASPSAR